MQPLSERYVPSTIEPPQHRLQPSTSVWCWTKNVGRHQDGDAYVQCMSCGHVSDERAAPQHHVLDAADVQRWSTHFSGHEGSETRVQCMPGQYVSGSIKTSLLKLSFATDV